LRSHVPFIEGADEVVGRLVRVPGEVPDAMQLPRSPTEGRDRGQGAPCRHFGPEEREEDPSRQGQGKQESTLEVRMPQTDLMPQLLQPHLDPTYSDLALIHTGESRRGGMKSRRGAG
jgi:hypothetical protein